jgi:ABC-type multidrug transport system ATPase subunit
MHVLTTAPIPHRRLAVGCELLGEPALLIADEPTTGLDTYQAERIVRLVKHTAASRGIPAIATLHQPRSSIWSALDDVLVRADDVMTRLMTCWCALMTSDGV